MADTSVKICDIKFNIALALSQGILNGAVCQVAPFIF